MMRALRKFQLWKLEVLLPVASTIEIARWYRADAVFSHDEPWSVDWCSTWFMGLMGGLAVTLLALLLICGSVQLVRWMTEADHD